MNEEEEELERGAELQLAQRHRILTPGVLHGRKLWEAAVHTPGTTGSATFQVSISGRMPKESKFVLEFPDTGWSMPTEPNVIIKGPPGRPAPRGKAKWHDRILEITTIDEEIDGGAMLSIVVSGVSTPGCATPGGELVATTFEKKIVRNTVPPSIRGGQIIDGPTKITIPSLVPGSIQGPRRWSPSNCCPNAVSDVQLDLVVSGAIAPQGKILIELPSEDGWRMPEQPKVTAKLRPHIASATISKLTFSAKWNEAQHVLEIVLVDGQVPMQSTLKLCICQVTNPDGERPAAVARVTTLYNQGGGVIDGPAKIDVARVSELREADFANATTAFQAQAPKDGMLLLPQVVQAFEALSIKVVEEEIKSKIKITSIEEAPEPPPPTTKKGSAEAAPPQLLLKEYVTLQHFLDFFTTIYTPAFKFGEEMRLSAARGQLDRLQELLRSGCDPNTKDGAGWTALHYAAEHGVLGAINILLEAKADLNIRDVAGWTPLMCAASNGQVPVMARLLEMGADAGISSVEGRTALHWAATRGMDGAVSFLILGGATLDAIDRSKWTPLHCAAMHGSIGCAKLLLEHGANMALQDALGHLAWEYWEPPAQTQLQTHLEKLEAMGLKIHRPVAT